MNPGQTHPTMTKARGSSVRSPTIRKGGKDGTSWSPTEKLKRDRCMKQFSKQTKGYAVGVSEEFRERYDEIDWSDGPKPGDLENCGKKK